MGPSAVLGIEVKDGEFSISRSYVIGNAEGGIQLEGGKQHMLSNTVFAENGYDNSDTGGIYVISTSRDSVAANLTIANNEAKVAETGGIRCSEALTVVNTIVWNNLGGDARGVDSMCGAPNYSLLTEDFGGGVGNLFGDPQFIDPQYHVDPNGTGLGIDAGDLASAPPDDIDGDLRPLGLGVDIGADEAR